MDSAERSELDFVQKILMKFLYRENSSRTLGPAELEINAQNAAASHCGIGSIRLLWRSRDLGEFRKLLVIR